MLSVMLHAGTNRASPNMMRAPEFPAQPSVLLLYIIRAVKSCTYMAESRIFIYLCYYEEFILYVLLIVSLLDDTP